MEATCVDFEFKFKLSPEDAQGLFAVMNNNPGAVTPEQYQTGQRLYTWFYGEVQRITGVAQAPVEKKATKKKVA